MAEPVFRTPERQWRWAFLRAWQELRHSVWRGRPMTLPNVLRMYCRQVAALDDHPESAKRRLRDMRRLRQYYRAHQPFRRKRLRPPR